MGKTAPNMGHYNGGSSANYFEVNGIKRPKFEDNYKNHTTSFLASINCPYNKNTGIPKHTAVQLLHTRPYSKHANEEYMSCDSG